MMFHNWGWGLMGGFGMLLFWLLLIGFGVWLVWTLARSAPAQARGSAGNESPLDILRRRLASGEIDTQEFDAIRQKLGV